MQPVIRKAVTGDLVDLVNLHYDALAKTNRFYATLFKTPPKQLLMKALGSGLVDETNTILVAESDTGKTVGYIRYIHEAEKEQQKEEEAAPVEDVANQPPPSSIAKPHFEKLWGRFLEAQEEVDSLFDKTADGKAHIYLQNLVVHVDYQRRGIGRELLAKASLAAKEEKLPIFLTSTVESHKLFLASGFADLGASWKIDLGHWSKEILQADGKENDVSNMELVKMYDGVWEIESLMGKYP